MSESKIEWTDATWNPVTGCTKVSQGCKNCYAERVANRFWQGRKFTDVQCHPERLDQPVHWKKPRRIFVNSMSDLFHEDVPFEFVDSVFAVMNATVYQIPVGPAANFWHRYQILTKRPERMLEYVISRRTGMHQVGSHPIFEAGRGQNGVLRGKGLEIMNAGAVLQWPLPNVWLGVSVEDQKTADERIPLLLQTPAAVRFVSYEPALGPVNFVQDYFCNGRKFNALCNKGEVPTYWERSGARLDWVICGGESGPGARPMHPDWARSVRDQCQAAGVPYLFKQWGEWAPFLPGHEGIPRLESSRWRDLDRVPALWLSPDGDTVDRALMSRTKEDIVVYKFGKTASGRLLDGREWNEYPAMVV